jgi:hypothetical protein
MRMSRITFDVETVKVKTIVELLIDQTTNFSVAAIPNGHSDSSGRRAPSPNYNWVKPVALSAIRAMRLNQDPQREWHYLDTVFCRSGKDPRHRLEEYDPGDVVPA